jgi:hypothetical protein
MDINSFYQLSPAEFEITYSKWGEMRNADYENKWEQTRLNSFWSAAAYLKKRNVFRFMPFPWDKKNKKKVKPKKRDPQRVDNLKKKYGGTI